MIFFITLKKHNKSDKYTILKVHFIQQKEELKIKSGVTNLYQAVHFFFTVAAIMYI